MKESTKIQNIFCKVSSCFFSEDYFNTQLNISCIIFIRQFTITVSLFIEKPFHLFRTQTFSFQIV